MNIYTGIDELIIYAQNNLFLDDYDVPSVRNALLDILGLEVYYPGKPAVKKVEDLKEPSKLVNEFIQACVSENLVKAEDSEKVMAKIMRAISPLPSTVNDLYAELGGKGVKKADAFLKNYLKYSGFGLTKSNAFAEGIDENGIVVNTIESDGSDSFLPFCEAVDRLIEYAKANLLLDDYDEGFVRREIFELFGADTYVVDHDILGEEDFEAEETNADRPDALLYALMTGAASAGLSTGDDSEQLKIKVMNILSAKNSVVADTFNDFSSFSELKNPRDMNFLYGFLAKNYFFKKTAVERNPRFKTGYTGGDIEVTIDKNDQVVKNHAIRADYPKCVYCEESVGYVPAYFANKRTAYITLGGKEYLWSFLPYGFMPKHGILSEKEHKGYRIDKDTIGTLMDFVDKYPSFFIGCDAPITGAGAEGMGHMYYQAGEENLPIQRTLPDIKLEFPKYPLAEISILKWYNNVIRITTQSRQVLTEIAEEIRLAWENYTDESLGIIAKDKNGQHNGVSYTLKKLPNGRYLLDIILRSNITSKKYPEGVFTTHPENKVIKESDNNMLDAQGLFVLPGRTDSQIKMLCECLAERQNLPEEIEEFRSMYDGIIKEYGRDMTHVEAGIYVKTAFCRTCQSILKNIAVFEKSEDTAEFLTGLGHFVKV